MLSLKNNDLIVKLNVKTNSDRVVYTFQLSKLDTWQVLKMSHPNQNSFITLYCSTDSPNKLIGVSCLLIHAIRYNNVILYTFIPIMLTWQHSCILTTAPFLPLFPLGPTGPINGANFVSLSPTSANPSLCKFQFLVQVLYHLVVMCLRSLMFGLTWTDASLLQIDALMLAYT